MKMPDVDTAMFNGPIGEITAALDEHTEGSRVGVLVSLLAGFSAYLGHGTKVQTDKGLSPLSFWPVLVGVTGQGRKGTATGIAMNVLKSAFKTWADTNIVVACPATGLGFLGELEERTDDSHNARPTLFLEEEMGIFIDAAKRDTKIGGFLCKAWDGSDLRHRSGTTDLVVKNVHTSWIGHVQPKNWGAISGSKDATRGTYNRFFPVAVERSKTLPMFGGTDPTDVIREQGRRLRSLARDAREVDRVTVSAGVAEVFEAKHRPACESLITGNEELAQMSERAMAYMVRLAALYALIDSRDEIEVEDFDAALALVKYSVDTVVNVLPDAGGDRITTKISEALQAEREMSRMELWDVVGRNNVSARDLSNALLALPQVQEKTVPTKGRPSTVYTWIEETADDKELVEVA
jgi:hypothetical protein